MPDNESPVRFELNKNGEYRATGGVEFGLTILNIVRIAHDPNNIPPDIDDVSSRERYLNVEFSVHFASSISHTEEYLHWTHDEPLSIGDEITVRILGPGPVSEPVSRRINILDSPRSSTADYAAELRAAEEEYDAAIDGILSGLTLSKDEFYQHVRKLPSRVRRFKQALTVAIEGSDGDEQDDYRQTLSSLKRFPASLLATVSLHRHRMGIEPE